VDMDISESAREYLEDEIKLNLKTFSSRKLK